MNVAINSPCLMNQIVLTKSTNKDSNEAAVVKNKETEFLSNNYQKCS